ncbi:MAG: AMP-binding protein [Leptolyngbyaceae cyanobacterium MO_188.B28]|nr:AMP-binding protein [Leptolyngbyaceae cyanobacterium MO_188.B28]
MAKQLSLEQIITCGVEKNTAADLLPKINQWLASLPAADCWRHLSQHLLKPGHPFPFHQLLYKTAFLDWKPSQGPPPAWIPTDEQIQTTNIAALMRRLKLGSYPELHAWSVQHRAEFWQTMIQRVGICFREKYTKIVDFPNGPESPEWLSGACLNIAESCFQAPENAPAIVFQSEAGILSTLTYGELHALTNRVANGLVDAGFQPGDAIAIDMPMTVESVAIYLGIVKAGCIVVSIADSFPADEIATRLRLSKAKGIFTQMVIQRAGKRLPLYARVINADAPKAIVLTNGSLPCVELREGDLTWEDFLSPYQRFEAVSTHPGAYTNILFSSGTTGEPKAIPWTQTTPIKCAVDGHLHQDIQSGDVVAWPTNLGWMMGPWLIYASLINQAAIALYEGVPTERGFGQFIQDTRVTMLGVVPSMVSAWKAKSCMCGLDWSSIKVFSSTGECSNPEDMLFLMSLASYRPIIEYCGGTEIGGGYLTGTPVQPVAPSTFTTPALGLDILILNPDNQPADKGEVFITPPSIGLSNELLNRDHHQVYFANTPQLPIHPSTHPPIHPSTLRRHGDQIERLPNGYYRAHGRVDDTMNLGGVKVSSTEIEQVLNVVVGIQETAAIAVSPPDGGPSQLVIYTVTAPAAQKDKATLMTSLQTAIRQHLNPLFKIHQLMFVETLPRTASNKVMRRVLRDQYMPLTEDQAG